MPMRLKAACSFATRAIFRGFIRLRENGAENRLSAAAAGRGSGEMNPDLRCLTAAFSALMTSANSNG